MTLLTRVAPRVFGSSSQAAPGTCRCGHVDFAHQHYRRGTDCALCECSRFHR